MAIIGNFFTHTLTCVVSFMSFEFLCVIQKLNIFHETFFFCFDFLYSFQSILQCYINSALIYCYIFNYFLLLFFVTFLGFQPYSKTLDFQYNLLTSCVTTLHLQVRHSSLTRQSSRRASYKGHRRHHSVSKITSGGVLFCCCFFTNFSICV